MPRLANTSDTRLRLAKPKLKEYRIGCGSQLFLRVTPSGFKYWQLRYYRPDRREAIHQFGSYPAITLANARILRDQLLIELSQGKDPVHLRQVEKIAKSKARLTFDQCAEQYILAKQPEWKNAKHAQQWTNTLATYASPVMGNIPVADVSQDHVLACLQPIWLTKTETASRLRGRIEAVLDWAKVRGLRIGDNPAVWKGGLQSLLAAPKKAQQSGNHASMSYAQAPTFMRQLLKLEGAGAKSLAMVILTACRSGEVRLTTWGEFQDEIWTIPAERMKAEVEHRVPLSKQVLSLLATIKHPQSKPTDFVFPGTKSGKPTSNMTMAEQLKRMGLGDFTVHGFRSTFRVWTAEKTNYPREVCEHALAHSLPDKVEAAYMRSDYLYKRTALMQEWADFCSVSI
ncbi:MAG: integrase arm-type DNA-binding domain-containing protein [Burkholderiaceae bacterium]